MKLSEIITNFVDHPEHPNEPLEGYLLFSRFRKPHIKIVENLDDLNDEKFAYRVINPMKVNIEYLYYYLKLNMGLFREKYVNKSDKYELDHLTVEFINNIEIPISPAWYNIEIQNLTVKFVRILYEVSIESIDSKLDKLLQKGFNCLNLITNKHTEVNSSDLYKIKNKELFFSNIKKGKFQDPINDYIEIINPDILDEEFLIYYLYYTGALNNPDNYYRDNHNFGEFHTGYLNIPLSTKSEQKMIVNELVNIHDKIRKLLAKGRANKLALRKLVDEL